MFGSYFLGSSYPVVLCHLLIAQLLKCSLLVIGILHDSFLDLCSGARGGRHQKDSDEADEKHGAGVGTGQLAAGVREGTELAA